MDTAIFSTVVFFASIAFFAHLFYKLSQKRTGMVKWRERWVLAIWGILGFLMFLSGVVSENLALMVVGAAMAFVDSLAFLSSYVESERRVKRALEVVSGIVALVLYVYGYVVTGSFILVVIISIVLVALAVSYLLPRIRSKPKNCGVDVKNEGQEKGDFAYNVGRELGREIRKGLEENWKSHVIAGVIAGGCGLFSILLKPPWYFILVLVFISYHAAYSALSKLFEK